MLFVLALITLLPSLSSAAVLFHPRATDVTVPPNVRVQDHAEGGMEEGDLVMSVPADTGVALTRWFNSHPCSSQKRLDGQPVDCVERAVQDLIHAAAEAPGALADILNPNTGVLVPIPPGEDNLRAVNDLVAWVQNDQALRRLQARPRTTVIQFVYSLVFTVVVNHVQILTDANRQYQIYRLVKKYRCHIYEARPTCGNCGGEIGSTSLCVGEPDGQWKKCPCYKTPRKLYTPRLISNDQRADAIRRMYHHLPPPPPPVDTSELYTLKVWQSALPGYPGQSMAYYQMTDPKGKKLTSIANDTTPNTALWPTGSGPAILTIFGAPCPVDVSVSFYMDPAETVITFTYNDPNHQGGPPLWTSGNTGLNGVGEKPPISITTDYPAHRNEYKCLDVPAKWEPAAAPGQFQRNFTCTFWGYLPEGGCAAGH